MNILVDIGHPAHVHFFRNSIRVFNERGHTVYVVARNKDVSFKLLEAFDIQYIELGKHYRTLLGKLLGGFVFIFKFAYLCKKYKIDIVLDSGGTVYPAFATSLVFIPNISFNNTDVFSVLEISKYFTTKFITPISYKRDLGKNHIRVNSFNELAFLHPSIFKPNNEILRKLGVGSDENYYLLRFVKWDAAEEVGSMGHTVSDIRDIVNTFAIYGKVFISCEYELPGDLKKIQLEFNTNLKYGEMQDVEYYASLFYGESGAMATESAMLGVPSIFVSSKKLGFTTELEEQYGLIYNYTTKGEALKKGVEIINDIDSKSKWEEKKNIMLSEKFDYTKFIVWFVEHYPESTDIVKNKSCEYC